MKQHLAVLCGIYYPEPSPTGLCVKRFVELLKDTYDIDILCLSANGREESTELADGVRVFTLCGHRIAKEYTASGIAKKLLHIVGGLEIKTRFLGNLAWFRNSAFHKLNALHGERAYDAVFSVCSPLAAHAAAVDFKTVRPEVQHVAYTVDPYSEPSRIRPFLYSLKRLVEKEKALLAKADVRLLSEEVAASRRDLYESAEILPYMLPEEIPVKTRPADKRIDCVYAGSFYKDLRNPEPMLKAFSTVNNPHVFLHLYASGCADIVEKYARSCDNIVVHPRVSQEEIRRVYQEADVLVNIGNAIPEFLPSKTFEYIASGKPIVHFCNGAGYCAPLAMYPLALQYEGESQERLEAFLVSAAGNTVSYKQIEKLYQKHSKENIRRILLAALKRNH